MPKLVTFKHRCLFCYKSIICTLIIFCLHTNRLGLRLGFDRVVIVSDDFHVNRALFIADRCGLEAIALRSETVGYGDSRKVRMREYFARVKAVLDLYFYSPGTEAGVPDAPALTRK